MWRTFRSPSVGSVICGELTLRLQIDCPADLSTTGSSADSLVNSSAAGSQGIRRNAVANPATSAAHQDRCRRSSNAAAAGVMSQALGLIGGACLWHRRAAVAATLQGVGHAFVVSVAQLIVWLMGAPAGLKLHEELSGLLGGGALWVLHSAHAVYSAAAAPLLPGILGAVALCSALLGATGGLALAADLAAAVALPLALSHMAMAALFRWQVSAMRAMWALLRGHTAPRRPFTWGWIPRWLRLPAGVAISGWALRRGKCQTSQSGSGGADLGGQGDTAEHGSPQDGALCTPQKRLSTADGLVLEQLIVGVLLFTPLLLLLPTTLVFLALSSLLRTGLSLVLGSTSALRVGLRLNPAYAVALRLWRPAAFPVGVYFEGLAVGHGAATVQWSSAVSVDSVSVEDARASGRAAPHVGPVATTYVTMIGVPCSMVSLVVPCLYQMLCVSGVPPWALNIFRQRQRNSTAARPCKL